MLNKRLLSAAICTLGLSSPVLAADIELGDPIYGGSGCPTGTASATLSPDRKTLSVLFDQYIAEAGHSVGRNLDRKSCNLAIPVSIPNGLSVSILKVDYRGFVSVPRGGLAQLGVEYFFAGARGPRTSESFRGPVERDYTVTDNLMASAIVWSGCGEDVTLRVNSNMLAKSNSRGEDVLATVDSTDVDSQMVYHLQFRSCRGGR
jgi:hypothetical protein